MGEVHILKYWLNLDTPSKYATLHLESCKSCKPYQQKNKGINEIVRGWGGWFEFDSFEMAKMFYEKHYPSFIWHLCMLCCPK